MIRGCCPWAGRLVMLALLGLGVSLVLGCGCGCGDSAPAPEQSPATGDNAEAACDSEKCCTAQALTDKSTADKDCADCEKCPLCSADKAKTLALADKDKGDAKVPEALSFTMKTIDGKPAKLSKYQGKVVVFVNVASKCGYTPQYKALQELHAKYADKGVAVVGVPANDFGKQEPGTNLEIAEFCSSNYGVKFDMLEKVVVKGPGQCELYSFLTSKDTNPKFAGEIKWNFEKFVVGRNGEVVARFGSKIKPDDAEFVKVIDEEVAKK